MKRLYCTFCGSPDFNAISGIGDRIINAECAKCGTNMIPTETKPNYNAGYIREGRVKYVDKRNTKDRTNMGQANHGKRRDLLHHFKRHKRLLFLI